MSRFQSSDGHQKAMDDALERLKAQESAKRAATQPAKAQEPKTLPGAKPITATLPGHAKLGKLLAPKTAESSLKTGMAKGETLANQWFQPKPEVQAAMKDIMSRYQSRLGGFYSPELAAMRAENSRMIDSEALAAQRALRAQQAASGVRGASATAGMQNVAQQAINARAASENQLLAKQADMQRQALADYARAVTGERFGQLSTIMGMGGLGVQMGASDKMNQIMEQLIAGQKGEIAKLPGVDSGPGSGIAGIKSPANKWWSNALLSFAPMGAEMFERQYLPQWAASPVSQTSINEKLWG